MTRQLGIELSNRVCRIVSVLPRAGSTVVLRFESVVLDDPGTAVRLNRLRGSTASVVAWDLAADHTRVVVDDESYEHMRAAARARAAVPGHEWQDSLSDIGPAFPPAEVGDQRALIVVRAPRAAVDRALRPLTDAGIRIRTLTTPAGALVSLARLRSLTEPDAVALYVALDQSATCLTVVAGGVLVGTRVLEWGFREPADSRPRDRAGLAKILSESVTAFLRETGQHEHVGQAYVCGSLAGLRSLCASLNQWLDIEVEPLDSLFGIDANHLPRPADGFRERAAELRLAWAVATDRRLPLDLLRPRARRATAIRFARGAVAAGVVAGMGVGLAVQSRWPLPSVNAQAEAREADTAAAQQPRGPDRVEAAPNEQSRASSDPADSSLRQGAPDRSSSSPGQGGTFPDEAPAGRDSALRPRASERAIPFDAQLTSILISADRAVAIIDGQIVQPGSVIHGARVIEILESEVLLRDQAGRLRRVDMGGAGF